MITHKNDVNSFHSFYQLKYQLFFKTIFEKSARSENKTDISRSKHNLFLHREESSTITITFSKKLSTEGFISPIFSNALGNSFFSRWSKTGLRTFKNASYNCFSAGSFNSPGSISPLTFLSKILATRLKAMAMDSK